MLSYADIKIKALSSLCCTRHLKSVIHFVGIICTHVPLTGYTGSPRDSQYNREVYAKYYSLYKLKHCLSSCYMENMALKEWSRDEI